MTQQWIDGQERTILGRAVHSKLLRVCVLLTLSAALWHVCNRLDFSGRTQVRPAPEPSGISNVIPITQARKLITCIVKQGDTFASILTSHGVAQANMMQYYHSLKSNGFQALFPGDSIVLSLGEQGKIDTLSLLSRLQCWYRVIHEGETIQAGKETVEVITHRCLLRGTLSSCLSEDICALGAGDALVAGFADIFAWDINFFLDPRKGDRFEMIFERRYAEGRFIGYGAILAAAYYSQGGTFYAFAMKDADGRLQYYDENGKSVQKQFLKAPLHYSRVSSGYSFRRHHPILGIARPHLGVDYAAPVGTPVLAAADGVVNFAGVDGGFGKVVRINHGASYQTAYGHLHSISPSIAGGAHVKQGDVVGTVGSTGLSTGPHLDYRFRIGGRFVNPLTVSLPSKSGVSADQRFEFGLLRCSYATMLGNRFCDRNGCFVLDIEMPQRADPRPSSPSMASSGNTYGDRPGS